MQIQTGVYSLKEFCDLLNISSYVWKKRKEDLLEHLKDYFDYTIELGGYHNTEQIVTIKEVYDDYEPLPRKTQIKEKQQDYKTFTLDTIEKYPLNTTSNIARKAIKDQNLQSKWHHKKTAAANYIKPVINSSVVCKEAKYWCKLNKDINEYEPLTADQYNDFKDLLQKMSADGGMERIAEIISLYKEGEISKIEYQELVSQIAQIEFQFVFQEFKAKYGFIPVKVPYLKVNKD